MPTNWSERKSESQRLPDASSPDFAARVTDLADEAADTVRVLRMGAAVIPLVLRLPEAGRVNELASEMARCDSRQARWVLLDYLRRWAHEETEHIERAADI